MERNVPEIAGATYHACGWKSKKPGACGEREARKNIATILTDDRGGTAQLLRTGRPRSPQQVEYSQVDLRVSVVVLKSSKET